MGFSAEKVHAFKGHSGAVYALSVSQQPGIFLSGSSDRMMAGWELSSGLPARFSAQFPSPVYSILSLPDAQVLAGTGAGSLHFLNTAQKKETKILQLHKAQVFDLAYSAKHRLIFSAGGDGQMAVIDAQSFSMIMIRTLCHEKVRGLALSPDEGLLAVACGDGRIRIFALPAMEETIQFTAHRLSANCLAWDPAGRYLLSGGRDAYLNAWDVRNHFAPLSSIPAHNFALYSIVFDPAGKMFATGSRDKTIKIWDADSIRFGLRIDHEKQGGHVNSVNRLLWMEEGLLSAGDDRSILLWDIRRQAD